MEIILENVTLTDKKVVLKNINLRFTEKKIIGICGEEIKSVIGRSISNNKNNLDGILINNENNKLLKIAYLTDIQKQNDITVKEVINQKLVANNYKENNDEHIINALKMVGLNEDYLVYNINDLSTSEVKKIMFASAISYNPDIIILDEFHIGLNEIDKKLYKNILNKLKTKFNKIIIIITNDLKFLFNFCDELILASTDKIEIYTDKDKFYHEEIYQCISMPAIIDFINYLNSLGIKMDKYIDIRELIKAIYRDLN